ncbi:MAG: tetratricopeptide repeat protein, partial [Woeseiaceae bacterium]
RNVVRVAFAYIVVAWLLLQVSDTLVPALHLPEWFHSGIALLLILGFPIAILFAWAFEMTPEGLKKEKEVDRSASITHATGRKLDFIIIAVLACAAAFFAFDKFATKSAEPEPQAEQIEMAATATSIAVLPFVNMSDDASNEYFSDGLSEELLNLLAKIPEMHVAARTSSFAFKDQTDAGVAEIARELNVAHVLEGSVRKAGNQVRITAQLIDAATGYHLWSETYDRELENIFAVQDEIAANVTGALKVTLLGEAPVVPTTNPEAYELFLQAQYVSHQDDMDAYQRAIELYEQAVVLDPGYAPAWAELGFNVFWYASYGGMPIAQARVEVDAAVTRALQLDPGNARAYYVRGLKLMAFEFKVTRGMRDIEYAYELEPGNVDLILAVGRSHGLFGRYEKALKLIRTANALDPLRPRFYNFIGLNLWVQGRYDEALEAFEQLLTLAPEYPGAYRRVSGVLIAKGDYERALEVMSNEVDEGYRLTGQASAHAVLGNTAEADATLNELIEKHANQMAAQIAEVYGYRGDVDATFEWLERAYDANDPGIIALLNIRPFRILHDDPRWLVFLEKMEMLDAWRAMPPERGGPQ